MFALIAQEGRPDGFQRIFDDGYCKNCSKIRGSCSSRDPARRVSPAGPLCHCFAGIMRSNCALEEGRREERENKKKGGGGEKEEEEEEEEKRKRNESGRSHDRSGGKEKPSPVPPRVKRASRVLCSRFMYARTSASRES